MTVQELMVFLKDQPQDMEVLVNSYEHGYDPLTDLRQIQVVEVPEKEWYVGVYDDTEESGSPKL